MNDLPIVQGFESLVSLSFAQFGRIAFFKEGWGEFNQPFGVDSCNLEDHQYKYHDNI